MLAIRFNRVGKKNKAQFRIVVQEHTIAPGGRHVEIVGSYDPHSKKGVFKNERIKYWIDKGAQVSDSVYNLLVTQNIIEGKKRLIKISKKKEKGEEDKTEVKPAETKDEKVESPKKPVENKETPNQSAKADATGKEKELVAKAKPVETKDEKVEAPKKPVENKKDENKPTEVKAEEQNPVKSSGDDNGAGK